MKRKDFIRNTLLGLAACMLPKLLQPLTPEVSEEEVVGIPIVLQWKTYEQNAVVARPIRQGEHSFMMYVPKKDEERIVEYLNSIQS